MIIKFRVAGKPSTKQRPRWYGGRMVNPPANIISENDVRTVWREEGEPRFEEKAPLRLVVTVGVMRPESHRKKNGELSAEGQRHQYPENKKPDLDNAVKLIMDALNTRAYRDDVQIVQIYANRVWVDWPETQIYLEDL